MVFFKVLFFIHNKITFWKCKLATTVIKNRIKKKKKNKNKIELSPKSIFTRQFTVQLRLNTNNVSYKNATMKVGKLRGGYYIK